MKRRKRPITLMEILIAMALMSVLFSALFYGYKQLSLKRLAIQKSKQQVLVKSLLFAKLTQIFAKVSLQKEDEEKKEEWVFTSTENGLIFTYDNGIDPDPNFRGDLRAMIHLNPHKELTLVNWSKQKEARREVLLEMVDDCAFEFFDLESKQWISSWEKDDAALPPMVRLIINQQPFTFFLPKVEPIILYHSQEAST